jgi:S1-C subfamily serine protease
MSILKFLLRLKIRLISAILLAAFILITPILFNKGFRKYIGSSVFIVKDINEKRGSGSGFIVRTSKGKRYFVTNNHVCEGLEIEGKILISSDLLSNDQTLVKVLKKDPNVDLCIAEAPASGRGLFISNSLSIGDNVHIFGHPVGFPLHKTSGEAITPLQVPILKGTSLFDMHVVNFDAWQISAPSSPGNSGSPVVDNLGRVIGILFAGNNVNSYTSYIIPAKKLSRLLETL